MSFLFPQSTIQKELYFLFPRSTKSAERKSLNLHRDVNLKQGLYSRHKFGKTERPFPRPGRFVENVFCGARCWKVGEFHDHGQQRLQKGDKYLTCIIARPRDCSVTHTSCSFYWRKRRRKKTRQVKGNKKGKLNSLTLGGPTLFS